MSRLQDAQSIVLPFGRRDGSRAISQTLRGSLWRSSVALPDMVQPCGVGSPNSPRQPAPSQALFRTLSDHRSSHLPQCSRPCVSPPTVNSFAGRGLFGQITPSLPNLAVLSLARQPLRRHQPPPRTRCLLNHRRQFSLLLIPRRIRPAGSCLRSTRATAGGPQERCRPETPNVRSTRPLPSRWLVCPS